MYRDRVKPLKQKGHGYEIDAYWSLQGEKTLKQDMTTFETWPRIKFF